MADFPVDGNQIMNQVLTDGFSQAAIGMDISEARVAEGLSGALIFPGLVEPVRSGVFTPDEQEEIIRGLENYQGPAEN